MTILKALFAATFVATSFAFSSSSYAEAPRVIDVAVTTHGFDPEAVNVKPGENVTLRFTRKTDSTCATEVVIPSRKLKKDLPLNQAVSFELGKVDKGEIKFGCAMNMINGKVLVN